MEDCAICGESLDSKYKQRLSCNHEFHYECILKTFLTQRRSSLKCPYCRCSSGKLPLVNGLKKLHKGIHYDGEYPETYSSHKCTATIKSGKRKGMECGLNCQLGYDKCSRHQKMFEKESKKIEVKETTKIIKNEVSVKKMGLGDALELVQLEQALEVTANA